ncbi:hypothetical protein SAY86_016234 [Trapa natans]|uniref:Uncharacterized protein n=1 Tax=Trapa natans TaxID=22666 RepID=A0AAN7QWZ4_TRANT|nr:hypothetical protein SAY86_016234 [Trapa natans]
MASIKLMIAPAYFLCLLFSLHACNSRAQKGTGDMPRTEVTGTARSPSSADKEIHTEIHSVELGGRKMKMRKRLGGDTAAGGSKASAGEASEIPGANAGSLAGSRDAASNKLRLKSKGQNQSGKVKKGGFVAFVADYHVPKSHPPKHN